jgi:hypothetical protein
MRLGDDIAKFVIPAFELMKKLKPLPVATRASWMPAFAGMTALGMLLILLTLSVTPAKAGVQLLAGRGDNPVQNQFFHKLFRRDNRIYGIGQWMVSI